MRIIAASACLAAASAAIAGDSVPTLPGYGAPPSPWWSGYLTVGTKHMHYIFVQSTAANFSALPVSAWFNGGPGCSSLEGAFAELGQLLVNPAAPSTLMLNPFAWSTISNMLYIEAPACVGYSYGDVISDCSHNDSSQAQDNLAAVQAFYAGFPEYRNNDFFITGESYAGIYVPTLANAIVTSNAAGVQPHINLKGIAVGNGCLGLAAGQCAFDNGVEINTNVPYFAGHGLISTDTYKAFTAACPVGTDPPNLPAACNQAISAAHDQVGDINIYNIYGDCIDGSDGAGRFDKQSGRQVYKRAPVPVTSGGPIECIDETIAQWIGSPAAAAALHVNPNLNWAVCGSNSSFDYTRTEQDERVDIYPAIFAAGVRVIIYNGEADACVPYLDNEAWVESLNQPVIKPWTAWSTPNSQIGGYVTQYSQITFATVRGAGHMVPQTRPAAGLAVFNSLITGVPLA